MGSILKHLPFGCSVAISGVIPKGLFSSNLDQVQGQRDTRKVKKRYYPSVVELIFSNASSLVSFFNFIPTDPMRQRQHSQFSQPFCQQLRHRLTLFRPCMRVTTFLIFSSSYLALLPHSRKHRLSLQSSMLRNPWVIYTLFQ